MIIGGVALVSKVGGPYLGHRKFEAAQIRPSWEARTRPKARRGGLGSEEDGR